MTISKITSPIQPLDLIDKTNEIIDEVNSSGSSLPDMTGHSGDVLSNDGTNALWAVTATVYPITETWGTNVGWYRLYSDGWCEQGGVVTRTATTPITINLYKTYADYNYNVNVQAQSADNYTTNTYTYSPFIENKTTSSFQAVQSTPAITQIGYYVWETKGYIAST